MVNGRAVGGNTGEARACGIGWRRLQSTGGSWYLWRVGNLAQCAGGGPWGGTTGANLRDQVRGLLIAVVIILTGDDREPDGRRLAWQRRGSKIAVHRARHGRTGGGPPLNTHFVGGGGNELGETVLAGEIAANPHSSHVSFRNGLFWAFLQKRHAAPPECHFRGAFRSFPPLKTGAIWAFFGKTAGAAAGGPTGHRFCGSGARSA